MEVIMSASFPVTYNSHKHLTECTGYLPGLEIYPVSNVSRCSLNSFSCSLGAVVY